MGEERTKWGWGVRGEGRGEWGRRKETDSSVSSGRGRGHRPPLSAQSFLAGLAQLRVMLLPGH